MRVLAAVLVVVLIAGGLVGCPKKAPQEAPAMPDLPQASQPDGGGGGAGSPTITKFEVGKTYDRDTGLIGAPTLEFSAGDTAIHVVASMTGLSSGATVTCRLVAVNLRTAEGKTLKDVEIAGTNARAPDTSSDFHFDFHPTLGGWPTGQLQIEMSMNNKIIKTADVTIK
ncbi:MAG TPA: hypothetical protein DGT21_04715 [Armatimonadetes bacterium]|nr:hypothetical protein [Armatimonadota bacterium]